FAYRVRDPVSVGRFESVLVPVIVAELAASRATFYDGGLGTEALRAIRLVNDTELHLAAGPVTLFDPGGFAGTALLADVPPGEERWLSYAVDVGVHVTLETAGVPERLTSVRLRGGLLETEYRLRVETTVRVASPDDARFLVVELPRRAGFDVVAPTPAPVETAAALRFGIALVAGEGAVPADEAIPTHATCDAGGACTLTVAFERTERRTLTLANVDAGRLLVFLENPDLDAGDRAVLEDVVALQQRLAQLARDVGDAQTRLDAVFRDQERVRQNMAALDRNSTLYRRYLADLEAQEDEVDVLDARLAALATERRGVQVELDRLIEGLGDGD
ncbi:MAG: hypothetical protein P1P87_13750, partial [Trueperaceae bacterium]|nr:hypothetical protein [Trueperaceae bacterium]